MEIDPRDLLLSLGVGLGLAVASASVLAILVPLLALLVLGAIAFAAHRLVRRAFQRRAPAA